MKKARLMRLVKLLRKDAANKNGVRFNLAIWARPSEPRCRWHKTPADIPVNCGTSACAMGLAVISGEFEKEGLRARFDYRSYDIVMHPALGTFVGLDAAAALFGIDYVEASWLFSPAYYQSTLRKGAKGERAVADRIAKFVRDGGLPRNKKTGKRYSVSKWNFR